MINATPLLRAYAAFRNRTLASENSKSTQQNLLLQLLKKADHTRIGQDYKFSEIGDVLEYQKRIPLRSYDDFWKDYWQPAFPILDNCTWPNKIKYFSVSSGTTTGTAKYIPCSQEILNCNTKAGLDVLVHHLNNFSSSKIFAGKNLVLGGSSTLEQEAPGVFSGDLSGIVAKNIPWWIKPRYFPPAELALLSDWEEKIERIAKQALQEDIRMLSGVPSWMLIFLEKCRELSSHSSPKLVDLFPNLELIIHGGVKFDHYQPSFDELLEGSRAITREVYPCSEGFVAIQDRDYNQGMRLVLDQGVFMEFVPLEQLDRENPERFWIDNVELGVNYAIAVTTCAGLWSYLIGDTVRFVDLNPARVLITGRTGYCLSAFGEHLIEEEIEAALSDSAAKLDLRLADFTVAPVYPKDSSELGGHLYVIEFASREPSSEEVSKFAMMLDQELGRLNDDYKAHRSDGFGLKAPEVKVAASGFFRDWMKSRGKLGGQNKVPRVINDRELFEGLLEFLEKEKGGG